MSRCVIPRRRWIRLAALLSLGWSLAWGHEQTQWEVRPSMAYDALCLFNTLSGDPYYLGFYRAEFDHYDPLLQPAERQAFQQVRQILQARHRIVSSFLVLYFSAASPETIADLQNLLEHSDDVKARLQKTPYYSETGWRAFLEIRPHVKTALAALERVGFPADWEREVRPRIQRRMESVGAELSKRNIVPAIESAIGRPLSSDRAVVYLVEYSKPLQMRLAGTGFLVQESYPFTAVLHQAVHELLHPPYAAADVAKVLDVLKADPYLADKIKNHDKRFGYTSLPDYVEEDCVQAVEERITASLDVPHDLHQYWRQLDGGMHVLAVALYSLMEEEHFPEKGQPLAALLTRLADAGKLAPGEIERRNRAFFGE